ncbi:hypothetical protein [Ideonella sp. A 288]|uniref:hypothetical protein n=1 Tax=Ideonella sp. A 288 TaxID=1962181 RepID=UPI000B4B062D|nr:hypothetical protein [Ideonella sp. A 288]
MTTLALRSLCAALATSLLLTVAAPASAHRPPNASEASAALSLLPVAVVVVAPAMLLSGGAMLTVVAVQASATGTVWVLERASDGARLSVELVGGAVLSVGTGVAVIAMGTGWLLSAAGQAIAFIPNEIGASLLYNERVTR